MNTCTRCGKAVGQSEWDIHTCTPPAQPLPFGVGGGLVAIKTLLSRDPCVHANTAIQMIDAILAEQPTQHKPLPIHEIVTMYDECPTSDSCMIAFARAIEAAHGIKENT